MIVPLGERYQQTLYVLSKRQGQMVSEALLPTLFVPMTGAAEEQRDVHPDPAHPAIRNGGFEEPIGDTRQPKGWHYQRQLEWVLDPKAPEGQHFASFANTIGGQGCQALQGMALDGRAVREIDLAAWVRVDSVRQGPVPGDFPLVGITFYDERRATVGDVKLGPWQGTFYWRHITGRFAVPGRAREAVLRIGLLGATGKFAVDDLRLSVAGTTEDASEAKP